MMNRKMELSDRWAGKFWRDSRHRTRVKNRTGQPHIFNTPAQRALSDSHFLLSRCRVTPGLMGRKVSRGHAFCQGRESQGDLPTRFCRQTL